jgi:hypothetical protein
MTRPHYFAVAALALVMVSVAVGQAPQGGKTPPGKRSLDQQLLDDLDRELLEGLPAGKTRGKADSKVPATSPQAGEGAESQNPLAKIAERMRSVENRIAEHDTSAATQENQALIVSDLESLLEAAKKAQQRGKPQGGKGSPSGQEGTGTGDAVAAPPRDSTNRIERGTKEKPETADVKDLLRRIWGHLPEKLRDEMQASVGEQFLPKYERLIEEYYKRLAEERPGTP